MIKYKIGIGNEICCSYCFCKKYCWKGFVFFIELLGEKEKNSGNGKIVGYFYFGSD